jgi:thioredoxin-dependent peroxiredoxin
LRARFGQDGPDRKKKEPADRMLDRPAPEFELPATGGTAFSLSQARGRPLVLYFYPKDNTPGCTTEGQQFRDLHPEFAKLGCAVYGISRDSLKAHENFKAKMRFPFELLSDHEETACRLYNVIKMKKMYGKQVRGIERSTFVIDAGGTVRREWRGVKVPGHATEVLEFVRALQMPGDA